MKINIIIPILFILFATGPSLFADDDIIEQIKTKSMNKKLYIAALKHDQLWLTAEEYFADRWNYNGVKDRELHPIRMKVMNYSNQVELDKKIVDLLISRISAISVLWQYTFFRNQVAPSSWFDVSYMNSVFRDKSKRDLVKTRMIAHLKTISPYRSYVDIKKMKYEIALNEVFQKNVHRLEKLDSDDKKYQRIVKEIEREAEEKAKTVKIEDIKKITYHSRFVISMLADLKMLNEIKEYYLGNKVKFTEAEVQTYQQWIDVIDKGHSNNSTRW